MRGWHMIFSDTFALKTKAHQPKVMSIKHWPNKNLLQKILFFVFPLFFLPVKFGNLSLGFRSSENQSSDYNGMDRSWRFHPIQSFPQMKDDEIRWQKNGGIGSHFLN